jgi:hypothetical protein
VAVQQTVNYVALRYMGPRQFLSTNKSKFVLGRYALHFHMSRGFNDGSQVLGSVVSESGSHAFVAHMSDGITFDHTISYDTLETPYWWDVRQNEEPEMNNDPTNNALWTGTVAAKVTNDGTGGDRNRLSGYSLGCGANNRVTGAVAVGILGTLQASGYLWPSGGNSCPVWTFDNDLAHNNAVDGIFSWNIDDHRVIHNVTDFTAYGNGGSGVEHGAYRNQFAYDRVLLANNDLVVGSPDVPNDGGGGIGEVVAHALPIEPNTALTFSDVSVMTTRSGANALYIPGHRLDTKLGGGILTFDKWTVTGPTSKPIVVAEFADQVTPQTTPPTPTGGKSQIDFTCWNVKNRDLQANDFEVRSFNKLSRFRVKLRDGSWWLVNMPAGTPTPFAPTFTVITPAMDSSLDRTPCP